MQKNNSKEFEKINNYANKKKKKRVNKYFLRAVMLLVIIYTAVSVISLRIKITELEKRRGLELEALRTLETEGHELDQMLNADEKTLIEQTARDKLGLVYPDERVYIDIS